VIELTVDLLEDLAGRWRSFGAPVAESLRPGLADDEVDALTAPLERSLPPEARTWWAWHDGASGLSREFEPWPGTWLVPLERAVENSRWEWREASGLAGEEHAKELLWRPTWLPLLTTGIGDHITVDCAESDVVSPVYYAERESGVAKFEARAPSIGTMVSWWIEGFDSGACRWSQAERRWELDSDRLNPDSRRLLG
jgi:hypothetical protein